jgi:sterol desaturase/sphingolipid hydroxylase (fatty acid hydroxylase superfamily)
MLMTVQISGAMWGLFWYVMGSTLGGSLAGIALEVLIPGEKQSWTSRLRALPIWAAYIIIGLSVSAAAQFSLKLLNFHPLVLIDLRGSVNVIGAIAAYTALPLLGFFGYDFLYYWFHRILHRFRLLWRVHSVHHSIEELNAVNDYHHWMEDVFRVPLILIPISLLVRVDAAMLIICVVILRFMGQMTHANSKISYGWFRYVIAEPRFHRIHHSLENRHFDKNFAFMFPVWDVIFGTAYFPAADEYPKTGLANQEEPRSILNYIITPFKKQARPLESDRIIHAEVPAKENHGFQNQRCFSGRRLPLP